MLLGPFGFAAEMLILGRRWNPEEPGQWHREWEKLHRRFSRDDKPKSDDDLRKRRSVLRDRRRQSVADNPVPDLLQSQPQEKWSEGKITDDILLMKRDDELSAYPSEDVPKDPKLTLSDKEYRSLEKELAHESKKAVGKMWGSMARRQESDEKSSEQQWSNGLDSSGPAVVPVY